MAIARHERRLQRGILAEVLVHKARELWWRNPLNKYNTLFYSFPTSTSTHALTSAARAKTSSPDPFFVRDSAIGLTESGHQLAPTLPYFERSYECDVLSSFDSLLSLDFLKCVDAAVVPAENIEEDVVRGMKIGLDI